MPEVHQAPRRGKGPAPSSTLGRDLRPGDVLFTTPGLNEHKHRLAARRAHRARGKAAGWKWIRVFVSPEMLARIDALRRRTKETREQIILGGFTHAIDQRDELIARREKRDAAKRGAP